jgi:hypothetical protein
VSTTEAVLIVVYLLMVPAFIALGRYIARTNERMYREALEEIAGVNPNNPGWWCVARACKAVGKSFPS